MPQKYIEIEKNRLNKNFISKDLFDFNLCDTPSYFVRDHNSIEAIELMKNQKFDYILNAGTPRILRQPALMTSGGIINCHPGKLPDYRGCTAVEWSIYNNDTVGATTHFMDTGIDTGPILLYEPLKINQYEKYEDIRTKMLFHQANLLVKTVEYLTKNRITQISEKKSVGGKYYKPIRDELLQEVKDKLTTGAYSCQ